MQTIKNSNERILVSKKSHLTGNCKPKHFECMPGECIPSPWVCDGEEVINLQFNRNKLTKNLN